MHKKLLVSSGFLMVVAFVFSQQVNHSHVAYNNLGIMGVHDNFVIETGPHTYLQNGDLWLYSNFINNQTLTHDPSNAVSVMRFKGDVQQIVSGMGDTHVYDLQIDNNTSADAELQVPCATVSILWRAVISLCILVKDRGISTCI
jgi:hypothetical protein